MRRRRGQRRRKEEEANTITITNAVLNMHTHDKTLYEDVVNMGMMWQVFRMQRGPVRKTK
jgi:hypothetical protein